MAAILSWPQCVKITAKDKTCVVSPINYPKVAVGPIPCLFLSVRTVSHTKGLYICTIVSHWFRLFSCDLRQNKNRYIEMSINILNTKTHDTLFSHNQSNRYRNTCEFSTRFNTILISVMKIKSIMSDRSEKNICALWQRTLRQLATKLVYGLNGENVWIFKYIRMGFLIINLPLLYEKDFLSLLRDSNSCCANRLVR